MKKTFLCSVILVLLLFCGCARKEKSFSDIIKLPEGLPKSIEVSFDDPSLADVSISAEEDIEKIINTLNQRKYAVVKTVAPRSNMVLALKYNQESCIKVSINGIKGSDGKLYQPAEEDGAENLVEMLIKD